MVDAVLYGIIPNVDTVAIFSPCFLPAAVFSSRDTKNIVFPNREGSRSVTDCTDCEFSRQCVEDAMYANKHNQTGGQRWMEQRQCNND